MWESIDAGRRESQCKYLKTENYLACSTNSRELTVAGTEVAGGE